MYSVTQRVSKIKQPHGGYLPVKIFKKFQFQDGVDLYEEENISPALVGLAVDYLTRCSMGTSVEKAFAISVKGARLINQESVAKKLLTKINGLYEESIICACKLCGFDVCFRSSINSYKPISEIKPDKRTINNIKTMVIRSVNFLRKCGPVIADGLTFDGGYTNIISSGDGDFMTKDTLWDFKVSKSEITSKHTLQILVYYIMGVRSIHPEYKNIKKLGFFNPRLNKAYLVFIEQISSNIISQIENEVIGYSNISQSRNKTQVCTKACVTNAEYYTAAEVAEKLGRSKGHVYDLINSGRLPAQKIKNKYQIKKFDFEKYKDKLRIKKIIALICSLLNALVLLLIMIIFMSQN